jgi:hypothetical protein
MHCQAWRNIPGAVLSPISNYPISENVTRRTIAFCPFIAPLYFICHAFSSIPLISTYKNHLKTTIN